MTSDALMSAIVDAASLMFALHILVAGVGRLALMSWRTHRKSWQIIYAALVVAAALYLKDMAEGDAKCASVPLLVLMAATAAWFYESRDRWVKRAPDYMAINCPHLGADEMLPAECPLNKAQQPPQ